MRGRGAAGLARAGGPRAARRSPPASPPAAGDLEHRADEHAVHVAHEGVGLDAELEHVAVGAPSRRAATIALEARGGSCRVGVKAVKSCVPGSAAAQACSAASSSGCGHQSARPRSNGDGRAAGVDAVAVGAARASWRAEKPSGASSAASTAIVVRQQRVDRAQPRQPPVVGDDLAERVDAAVGAAGDGQRRPARAGRSPARASARPRRCARPAGRPSRRRGCRRTRGRARAARLRRARGRPSRSSRCDAGRA